MKSRLAYSLIEVIFVVIIIGVMAGLAIPHFVGSVENVKVNEGKQILLLLYEAQLEYESEYGSYTSDVSLLSSGIEIPALKNFQAPTASTVDTDLACNSGDGLVSIASIGGGYTLHMMDNGDMVCTPCDSDICLSLGFQPF